MARNETVRGYNGGAMLLHWLIAALILVQIAGGFAFARLDVLPAGLRFPAIQWHKTFGILILALTLARIAWRLMNPPPKGAPMHRAERLLAGVVHYLFYALMLVVPLSGWLMVSASPRRIPTLLALQERFPWPDLPVPAGVRGAAETVAANAHTLLAYAFLALLALHVAGALKHSAVDRAPSFRRILPVGHIARAATRPAAVPAALALVAAFLIAGVEVGRGGAGVSKAATVSTNAPAATRDDATGWVIDRSASKLGYEAGFSGKTVSGTVDGWTAAIRFDPNDPAAARAQITIDADAITIDEPFIRSNLGGADGLNVAAHPKAEVVLDRFERTPEGYRVHGTLRIKGIEAPVDAAFTFAENADGAATVNGSATFERLAYGLGAQNDPNGEWLGRTIRVMFSLQAMRTDKAQS